MNENIIAVNVPNFVTVTVMALAGSMLFMAARKALLRRQAGNDVGVPGT